MKEKIKERLFLYLLTEIINYLMLPYEVFLIGFSVEQSLVCRLLASLTDLIMVIFFFQTKAIWNADEKEKKFTNHIMAGIKMAIQFPAIYVAKVIFANSIVLPTLQAFNISITPISWSNIGRTLLVAFLFYLVMGMLYSILRGKISSLRKKIFSIFKKTES